MQLPDITELSWYAKIMLYAAVAAVGGFLGHIMRAIDKKEPINVLRALIESAAAGFVGMLVMLACSAMHIPAQWTGVIVGVCGWLGANATIRMLESLVYKKLGINKPEGLA